MCSPPRVARILVVEDDEHLAGAIRQTLEADGYEVRVALDGGRALAMLAETTFEAVLLDLLLPVADGYEVCASLNAICPRPRVLMITALGEAGDVLRGFDAGADDYLVKPFGLAELRARTRALLRRGDGSPRQPPEGVDEPPVIEEAGFVVRISSAGALSPQVLYRGEEVTLGSREQALLAVFLRRPGMVLSRDTIRRALWGPDSEVSDNAVDQRVSELRRALAKGTSSCAIESVHRVGWRFRGERAE